MKIWQTIHIHCQKSSWENEHTFHLFSFKLDNTDSRVYVGEQEIEIEVPDDYDPRSALIAALKEEQTKAAAAYQKTVTDIQRRISELQAIEFKNGLTAPTQ